MMTRLDQPHLPQCMCEDRQAGFPHLHGSQLGWREIGSQITSCVFFQLVYLKNANQPTWLYYVLENMFEWCLVRSNLILKKERAGPNWLLIVKFTAPGNPRALSNTCNISGFTSPWTIMWEKNLITCKQLLHLGSPIHYGRLDGHQGKHCLHHRI